MDFADGLHIADGTCVERFPTFDAKLVKVAGRLGAGKVIAP
jgi:hypothetical protein